MLSRGDIETMAQCRQCNINTSAIARLTSTRNSFRADAIWRRQQMNYLISRDDSLSIQNNDSSPTEKLVTEWENTKSCNYIYFIYDPTDTLTIFNDILYI